MIEKFPGDALVLQPQSGKPDLLFLLFHGGGADRHQMSELAHALRGAYPQCVVVAPDGPRPLKSAALHGFEWFDDDADPVGAVAVALPGFIAQIRQWAAHFELPWPRVALGGFSQGATMVLEAVQAEAELAGRVLCFGGAPLRRPGSAPDGVCLHLLHGLLDEEVPYRHIIDAAKTWVELGADVTADVLPGVHHTLDPQLIERALHQLRNFIPAKLWREAVQTAAEMDQADRDALKRGQAH